LQWLIANSRYYSSVTIDINTLQTLPIDGELVNLLSVSPSNEIEASLENHDQDSYPQSTFLPTSAQTVTEQQTIQQSILHPNHINWPSMGSPINEFTTEGYICSVFPTLFPQGTADFLAPRQRSVTIANYFKHLMLYHDQHFATHPHFRYFTLNTQMRHRALQAGRKFVHQNPHDGHLSIDDVREMIGTDTNILCNRVLHFGGSYSS